MAQAAQRDSRDGSVELDYDDLIIRGPTTFIGPVTFNNSVSGFTWPRSYKFTADPFNYLTASGTVQLPLANQVVTFNDFNTPPTNSHTNYFNISDPGGLITKTAAGSTLLHIRVRLTVSGAGLNVLGNYQLNLQGGQGAPPLPNLDQYYITVTSIAAPLATEITLNAVVPSLQNDVYAVIITATQDFTVTPEVLIMVEK